MEDDVHTGHPSNTIDNTSIVIVSMLHGEGRQMMVQDMMIVIVSMLFDEGREMMVQDMRGASGINKTMIHHILTKHLMKKMVVVLWVWVPLMCCPEEKQRRTELCQKHLICYKKERVMFLQQLIAINETRVCNFEPH